MACFYSTRTSASYGQGRLNNLAYLHAGGGLHSSILAGLSFQWAENACAFLCDQIVQLLACFFLSTGSRSKRLQRTQPIVGMWQRKRHRSGKLNSRKDTGKVPDRVPTRKRTSQLLSRKRRHVAVILAPRCPLLNKCQQLGNVAQWTNQQQLFNN